MMSFIKFYLSISIILLIKCQLNNALVCYDCNQRTDPSCGTTIPSTVATKTCDEICVTFKNKWDGGMIIRGCSSDYWIPPTGAYNDTIHLDGLCIKDKYSLELFCFCSTDNCNSNNTADPAIQAINECLSNPCLNGAACVDLYNKFQCQCAGNYDGPTCAACKPGFTGTNCNFVLPEPCASNPCQNAGTCNKGAGFNYTCTCPQGFTGINCEIDLNECLSIPCAHNGICTDLRGGYSCNCDNTGFTGTNCMDDVKECGTSDRCNSIGTFNCTEIPGSYKCFCKPGFTGTYCEVNINECASNPCKNGFCTDGENSYTCTCFAGFSGTYCNETVNNCDPTPCANGVCTNGLLSYTCTCNPGWTGLNCDTKISVCQTVYPCKYATACADGATYPAYTCTCMPGFTGQNCTININECSSNPCKNGAQCVDLISNYRCNCLPGFTGKDCDINIDECLSSPCLFGTCVDGINSFTCTCQPGFTGAICDVEINECASSPCLNTGKCVDLINGYACVCNTQYYTGVRCERPVLRCIEPTGVNPCNNNGDCLGGVGFDPIVCKCFPGYTGQFCETRISKCSGVTCLNGGTCYEDTATSFKCVCASGYSGVYCETKISPCSIFRVSCGNFGTCQDVGFTDYKCVCNPGYAGKSCETQYFQCTSVGTFVDPVYCENYIVCQYNTFGVLETSVVKCSNLSGTQLLFDPATKNCVFPTKHPNPSCYVAV